MYALDIYIYMCVCGIANPPPFFLTPEIFGRPKGGQKIFFLPQKVYQSIGLGESCSFPASKCAAGENFLL